MEYKLNSENEKESGQRVADAKDNKYYRIQRLSIEKRTKRTKEQLVKKRRTAASYPDQQTIKEIIQPTSVQASLESLNDDCLLQIFKYLQREDLRSLLFTCHHLSSIVKNHNLISKTCTTFEIKEKMVEKNAKCIANVVSYISNYVSTLRVNCGKKKNSDLGSIFKGCQNLKHLRIDNWNIEVFQIDPTLCTELELWWVKVNADFFNLLKNFEKLQLLVININKMTHHGWELDTTIEWPTKVKRLRLGGFNISQSFLMSAIEQLGSLEIIDLWACKLPNREIEALANARLLMRHIAKEIIDLTWFCRIRCSFFQRKI